jgi:hypothetical protein
MTTDTRRLTCGDAAARGGAGLDAVDDERGVRDVEQATFEEELCALINRRSMENESNTPDFILAAYMMDALVAFEKASLAREQWYGQSLRIGGSAR